MTSTSLTPQSAIRQQAAAVSRFTAEYRQDTPFVAVSRPRLSWVTATDCAGWQQTGAELRVARDGTVESALHEGPESVLVEWPFGAIAAGERVEVEVRVTGTDGGTTDWSAALALVGGYVEGPWQAEAIGLPPPAGEDQPLGRPGQLRYEFTVGEGLVQATLFATAHGVYQAEINGTEVDDQILKPGWTAYADRLNHETTDVTALLAPGANAVGVWLAGGWFTEKYGFHGLAKPFYGEQPAVKVELRLEYLDGSRETVASGPDWRASTAGPLVSSGIYAGEAFDARRAEAGWSEPGFDDAHWLPAPATEGGWAAATPAMAPPVRRIEELPVRDVLTTPSGATVLDFGQNLVGRLRIRVAGEAGRTITLRHAEVLEDGELALRPLRQAAATDTYTLAGSGVAENGEERGGEEEWEPRFTFHGFRYAQVDNWPGELDPAAITAVVIHNDMRRTGWFECSDSLLNRLHENALWGMRGNFLALPTDCPQRDERLGWTGDIQVFSPTASYLYDSLGFLGSWLQDLALEQGRRDGVVPIIVPSVLGMLESPVAAWGDAATVVPWVLFERFGDTGLLRRQYTSMRDWADALLKVRDSSGLWQGQMQLGDWLDPAAPPDKPGAARTHGDIVASAYLFRSLDLVAQAAAVLGNDADHASYAALAEATRQAFLAEYVTPAGRMVSDAQTAYSLALMFGISTDPSQRQALGDRLAELARLGGYRIATGFVGTPLIADALTVTGHLDAAERLLTQTECPSWLYPVTQGATTIWERWDSILEDGSVNPGEMTSFNHYALGAIADWMHRTVAGLAPAAPGYRKLGIAPRPLRSLTHASTAHETPYGLAKVAWKRVGERILVDATVPPGTTSVVSLPDGSAEFVVGSGQHRWDVPAASQAPEPGAVSLHSPLADIMDDPAAYAAVWQAMEAQDPAGAAAFRKDTVWYRQATLDQSLIFTQPAVKQDIAAALATLAGNRSARTPQTPELPSPELPSPQIEKAPMTTFTAESPLYFVMRHAEGNRILSQHVPTLTNNPLLHTLYFHEVGMILGTEDALQGKPEEVAEILRLISELEREDTVAQRTAAAAVDVPAPAAGYEPETVERGSATVSLPTTAAAQERFEITFAGPSHGNPFTDVDLRALFTAPSGKVLSVPGFYDGDGTYKVRLLVPEAGEWTFSTSSNARSLDAVTGSFSAAEAEAGARGVVRVANTFHFAYDDGTPYLPIGTTAYAWTHQGDALEKQTLDTLAAGPFNKMRMCVFPKSYLFNENEPDLYPFEGSLAGGFDYERPNPAFYRHFEQRISQLDELGIEADLILFHAYDRWGFSTMTPGQDDRYLKYVVARLAAHRNIWWSLANEYDLLFRKTAEDWERFAGIVQANDPSGHLLSIHNCHSFYDYSRPWITHSSIQRQDVHKTAEFTGEWRERWQKPVVIDECAYEGNIDQGWGNITGEEMTRRFWEGAVRGGYVGHGETYMHAEDILWWAKGGEFHGSSPARIAFLRRILEETPGGFLDPLPSSWDVPTAGIRYEYELSYFGFNQPTYRNFVMPAGRKYQVDIIDTWNMTVDTLPGTVEGRFRVELPGRQFIAVRIRAVS